MRYYDTIVVVIRDPLSRLISAFNFQHPSGEAPLPPDNRKIYNCFANISALGSRIFEDSECGHIARSDNTTHMGLGYCSYIGGVEVRAALLKHNNVIVIRSRNCESDSISALKHIKEPPSEARHQMQRRPRNKLEIDYSTIKMPQVYVNKKKSKLSTDLSLVEKSNLNKWMHMSGESQLYGDILELRRKQQSFFDTQKGG